MKNKIEFSENEDIQERQFINQKRNESICDSNQYSRVEQKRNKKSPLKIIKGKVKVYHNDTKHKHIDDKFMDDESELILVSDRMLQFLKVVSLFFILISIFLFFKKYS